MDDSDKQRLAYSHKVSEVAQKILDLIESETRHLAETPRTRVLVMSRIVLHVFQSHFALGLAAAAENILRKKESEEVSSD